jgi:formylglycine-generating enzyme required for sulfatase activity
MVVSASLVVGALALGGAWYSRIATHDATPARIMAPTASAPVDAAAMVVSPSPRAACPADMVPIPGGNFFMGSDEGLPMEKPSHAVSLAPFCMDKFEVTVTAYRACSEVGACKRAGSVHDWDGITSKDHATFDPLCNGREPEERGSHPINCVDWSMADRFCRETGKRLPTEAECEFAARGPDGRKYPWDDSDPTSDDLNACGSECAAWGLKNHVDEKSMYADDDGYATTAPVGSFPKGASRYGVEDMVGNVWEWVADYYAPYTGGDQTDPHGPATGRAGHPRRRLERLVRGMGPAHVPIQERREPAKLWNRLSLRQVMTRIVRRVVTSPPVPTSWLSRLPASSNGLFALRGLSSCEGFGERPGGFGGSESRRSTILHDHAYCKSQLSPFAIFD